MVKEKSPKCLEGDMVCIHCGCDTIAETFGYKGCEYGCYPNRMSESEWEEFKQTNNLKLS